MAEKSHDFWAFTREGKAEVITVKANPRANPRAIAAAVYAQRNALGEDAIVYVVARTVPAIFDIKLDAQQRES